MCLLEIMGKMEKRALLMCNLEWSWAGTMLCIVGDPTYIPLT
jgi:hypothetical protein